MSVALATASVGAGAESIINEHSTDIVNLLTWLLAGVGGLRSDRAAIREFCNE